MPTAKRNTAFFESEEGKAIEEILKQLDSSDSHNTESSYSINSDLYPDNLIPFVDKHKNYLIKHPSTDPMQYIANLKLITRRRVNTPTAGKVR